MSRPRAVPQDHERRVSGRVLLIDDDAALLALLAYAFTEAGYTILTAENGRKGVAAVDTFKPDLVVTDIVMPEMEGIGAILQIRRRPNPPKIIAISGAGAGGRRDYLSWAKHLGADEVLAKPFRLAEILALSNQLITSELNHLTGHGADNAHSSRRR